MSSPLTRWLALGALVLLPACDLNINRTGGNSEKGYFEIEPTGSLAVGAHLTYTVRDYEFLSADKSGIGFQLISASNDDIAHIRSMTEAADLVVDGRAPGQSRIDFSAVADGDRMNDAFTIDVETVTRLRLSACSDRGVYVRGTDGQVLYAFASSTSTKVIEGLGLYPFATIPANAVTLRPELSTVDAWQFSIPTAAPDQVRLVSVVAGDAADLVMTMIDAKAIDGVISTTDSSNTYYGKLMTLTALPTSAGRPVCAKLRRVVSSTTPSICKLFKEGLDVTSLEVTDDTVQVDFIAAGKCILTLSLPELAVTVAWPPWNLTTAEPHGGGGSDFDD